MYITFDEFTALGGREADNTAEFDSARRLAEAELDYYTQGRIKKLAAAPESVKLADAEIIKLLLDGTGDVGSYSAGDISVSFAKKQSADERIYSIIRKILPPELVYPGVER